jgi:hypothetical protein
MPPMQTLEHHHRSYLCRCGATVLPPDQAANSWWVGYEVIVPCACGVRHQFARVRVRADIWRWQYAGCYWTVVTCSAKGWQDRG